MSKEIRKDTNPYIARGMVGMHNGDKYIIIDEESENAILDPCDIDDKIKIYERELKGWFLDQADELKKSNDKEFIVLMVCMSYIEGVEQYKRGMKSSGKSRNFFIDSVKKIYQKKKYKDEEISDLYKQVRCGLFHDGMNRSKVILNDAYDDSIKFGNDVIKINTAELLKDIKTDFETYINELKDKNNIKLRSNFDKVFQVAPECD